MKNKQLSQWQVNYLNILLKFNFQIVFRSGKMNTKVDALTRMSLANVSESAQRLEDHFQTILTLYQNSMQNLSDSSLLMTMTMNTER